MKIKKDGKIITLTENDIKKITKKIISEQNKSTKVDISDCIKDLTDLPLVCDITSDKYNPESCLMSVITMKTDIEAINCIKKKLNKK
jgi:hypothetical protein